MFLEEKNRISDISEFSILPYTQNRKLRNLGKCYFTSKFVFPGEKVKPYSFFVTFNITSHLSLKFH